MRSRALVVMALVAVLASSPAFAARADLHVHLTMSDALPAFRGEVDGPLLARHPDQWLRNQLTTEGLRWADVQLVVAALWPPFALRPARTRLDESLHALEDLKRFARRHPGFAIAHSPDEARGLMARDLIAVVPHLEGTQGVRTVDDIDALYAAGVRSLGLVHFADNALAEAREGQFGLLSDLLQKRRRPGGLTRLGHAAVDRMIALGILIDLAHANEQTQDDVLALAEAKGVPVIFSHAGSELRVVRTLDEARARRVARSGGLVGIGVFRHDVLLPIPEGSRLPEHALDTCDDVIAHWRYYAERMGAEKVMLGSDFNSPIHRPRPGGSCPHGIRNVNDLPDLFDALERHGLPREALDGSAERFLKVWERVEAAADPEARARALERRRIPSTERDAPL